MAETKILDNVTLDKSRMYISGRGSKFNQEGNRHFTILLDAEKDADEIKYFLDNDWHLTIKEDAEGNPIYRLKVLVKYTDWSAPIFEEYTKIPVYKNGLRGLEAPNGEAVFVQPSEVPAYLAEGYKEGWDIPAPNLLDEEESKEIDKWVISNVGIKINKSSYTDSKTGGKASCTYLEEMWFFHEKTTSCYRPNFIGFKQAHPEFANEIDAGSGDLPFDDQ